MADYRMMLVDGYEPDATGHTRRSDITGEVSGDGYTAGGLPVELAVVDDVGGERVLIRIPQVDFAGVTLGASGCVVYRDRGGAATEDELVCFGDFGETVAVEVGLLSVATADMVIKDGA
jgi:hypothetical protein